MTVLQRMQMTQLGSPPSLYGHVEALKEQVHSFSQQNLTNLEMVLNKIITDNQLNQQIANEILNGVSDSVDKGLMKINPKLGVSTNESIALWRNYSEKVREYKNAVQMGIENLADLEQDVNEAFSKAMSLQSSLSKLSGKAFEVFLNTIIPLVTQEAEGKIDINIDAVLNQLKSGKTMTTQGSDTSTITVQLGDKVAKITAPGKVDVSAEAPFITDDDLNTLKISAKNYSQLRKIHLLNGSVVSLIAQWSNFVLDSTVQNYYYSALGMSLSPEAILQNAKLMFGLQSLVGGKNKSDIANVFILNIRNKAKPIKVISMTQLINQAIEDAAGNQNMFDIKYSGFFNGQNMNEEDYGRAAKGVKINTSLNKAYIAQYYLRKLTL